MNLKERIKDLCKSKGISMSQIETDLKFGRGYLSKLGQTIPNASKIKQIADYFGVSVDYLLGNEQKESSANAEHKVNEDDIKVALFGGDREITDEMWKEITQYAEFLKQKYYKKP